MGGSPVAERGKRQPVSVLEAQPTLRCQMHLLRAKASAHDAAMRVRRAEKQMTNLMCDHGAEQDGRIDLHLRGVARDGRPGNGGVAGFAGNEEGESRCVRVKALRLRRDDLYSQI